LDPFRFSEAALHGKLGVRASPFYYHQIILAKVYNVRGKKSRSAARIQDSAFRIQDSEFRRRKRAGGREELGMVKGEW
jgi:hypothetical protein